MKKTAATGLIIVMLAICGLVSNTSTREGGPIFDEAISRPVTLARTAVLTEAISRAVTLGRPSELNEAISRAFTITISPCPWDLDGDGSVLSSDLRILLAAWRTNPGGPPDFDGGGVAVPDLLQLLANWGPCP